MLVQCPNCKTTYKVSDEVVKDTTPAFRCSRCRYTFEIEAEEPGQISPEADEPSSPVVPATPPAEERELSFSFPARGEVAALAEDQEFVETSPKVDAPLDDVTLPKASDHDDWSLHDDHRASPPQEAPFTLPEFDPATSPKSAFAAPGENSKDDESSASEAESTVGIQNILPMSSYVDQQASIMPFLTLFTLLLIGYGLAVAISYAHPKSSEALVKKIPLFGAAVLKNSHLKDGIVLQSLRGGYQSIQGNREVFVISGLAVNQNPVVIREIQLTSKIRNDAGKDLEEQTVWVGNTLSAKILRGMTLEDIPHLQSLKPLKSFEMPPGDSVPFAVVFLKAGRAVKDFTCVVSLADSDV